MALSYTWLHMIGFANRRAIRHMVFEVTLDDTFAKVFVPVKPRLRAILSPLGECFVKVIRLLSHARSLNTLTMVFGSERLARNFKGAYQDIDCISKDLNSLRHIGEFSFEIELDPTLIGYS